MIKASPFAKNYIKKNNLDINKIKGSGPFGRIIKRDLIDNKSCILPTDKKSPFVIMSYRDSEGK